MVVVSLCGCANNLWLIARFGIQLMSRVVPMSSMTLGHAHVNVDAVVGVGLASARIPSQPILGVAVTLT